MTIFLMQSNMEFLKSSENFQFVPGQVSRCHPIHLDKNVIITPPALGLKDFSGHSGL